MKTVSQTAWRQYLCHGPAGRPQTRSNPACTLPANVIPKTASSSRLNALVVLRTRAGAEKIWITARAEGPVRPMPYTTHTDRP